MGHRGSGVLLLFLLALFCIPTGQAKASPDYHSSASPHGPVVDFAHVDLAFANQPAMPATGWERRRLHDIEWLTDEADAKHGGATMVWVRTQFDRSALGVEPLAVYTAYNRQRVILYLNGSEFFRSFATQDEHTLGWNRPYLAPIPAGLIRQGVNELVMRVDAHPALDLGVGPIRIGPVATLRSTYDRVYFRSVTAAQASNTIMLFLAFAAFLLWLVRRHETELLWLVATGLCWYVRDHSSFAARVNLDPDWYHLISVHSVYFAYAALLSFCFEFFKLPDRKRAMAIMFGVAISIALLRNAELRWHQSDILCNFAGIAAVTWYIGELCRFWLRNQTRAGTVIMFAVLIGFAITIHDFGRNPNVRLWDGVAFNLQSLSAPLLFFGFLLLFGMRFVGALKSVEDMNVELADGIARARAELAASEEARRALEVDRALESERERLMREMHDGIGSNLVTALAIARQADESPRTIATLKRAISDLKITVDSLAPVDGDVVALLANFRHRAAPDLAEAGLTCEWRVELCPPLAWLNSENALQMLRIIQEAIGNVLTHANASVITISCAPAEVDGRPGVQIGIADNGQGFAPEAQRGGGRGIANMRARAGALLGRFEITAQPGGGTRSSLWLPLERG